MFSRNCVYILLSIFLLFAATLGGRTSGGGSRSGGSRSGGSRSGGGYGSRSSSGGYGSHTSSSSSRGYGGSGSSSSRNTGGSSGYGSNKYGWNTGSSSSSAGRTTGYGTGGALGGSSGYGWHTATNPKPSAPKPSYITPSHISPSQTHHHSAVIPARIPNKPTPKPLTPTHRPIVAQTHRPITTQTRSTPKPMIHHSSSWGKNSTGGNYGGIGGHGKVDDKVQKNQIGGQQSGRNTTGGFSPSAPIHPSHTSGTHSSAPINPHAPSAPPAPGFINPSGVGNHQPPGPGWHPSATHDAIQKQHVGGSQTGYPQQPPPYPGGGYPQQPPPYPGGGYPQGGHYPQGGQYPHGQAPPVYPGNVHYPNQPPPPYYPPGQYPQGHYPAGHYPVQSGGPAYYPQPPPPPPGYSPYGTPYYKDKSGIKASHVVAGLALWELMRSNQHHHSGYGYGFGVQRPTEIHHHHYNDGAGNTGNTEIIYNQPTYHDVMRERYTTRITPTSQNPTGPGAYNILEMTHYITPDEKGEIYSNMGNMTCTSVYNARSVSNIHMKQVKEFEKQFPNSVFPLYRNENETYPDNFTIVPGRIIHKEPVSITCCGTDKELVDISLLTSGKHPNVNCVNNIGHIPIRKITFIKTVEVVKPNGEWHQVDLVNPNVTTPTPLAPFPTINNSTPTPLAPYPTSFNSSTPDPNVSPVPETHLPMVVSSTPSVDLSQTFAPLGVNTSGVDMNQTFTIGSSTEGTIGVTSSPSDLVVG